MFTDTPVTQWNFSACQPIRAEAIGSPRLKVASRWEKAKLRPSLAARLIQGAGADPRHADRHGDREGQVAAEDLQRRHPGRRQEGGARLDLHIGEHRAADLSLRRGGKCARNSCRNRSRSRNRGAAARRPAARECPAHRDWRHLPSPVRPSARGWPGGKPPYRLSRQPATSERSRPRIRRGWAHPHRPSRMQEQARGIAA